MNNQKTKFNFIKKILSFFRQMFSNKKKKKDNQTDDIYPLW